MAEIIYLAKLHDRHYDDTYIAFRCLEDAIAQCEKWSEEYGDRYEWSVPDDWDWQENWKFYKDTFDDGPKVMVEEIKLL